MLEANELEMTYPGKASDASGRKTVHALSGVSLAIEPGEFLIVHGASGSGKSTLLLVLGGMLGPTSGSVHFHGEDIYALSNSKRSHYRKYSVGFIFQKFHLLPYLTVRENIRLPLGLRQDAKDADARIEQIAGRLGMAARLSHKAGELSVGEQQRAAMARTLIAEPQIILADEPTGNLDSHNSSIIAECLAEENGKGRAVILATHDDSLMANGHRRIELRDGAMVS